MILLLGFFTLSITFSFLCSIWEAVLLSIPASYVQIKKKEGGALGATLVEFKENVDKPLAAILTLNTIAHTVGAIGVGAAATSLWGETDPFLTGAVVPVVMTLAILIFSEIIPKTLGANGWKELAPFTIKSLRIVIWCLYPLVWLAQLITKFMKKDKEKSVLSRADFMAMTEIGTRDGVFEKEESKILKNLLVFNTVRAEDIMTPRTVVTSSSEETSIKEFYEIHQGKLRFSRIPIFRGSRDHVNSYFLKGDMLDKIIQGNGEDALKTIARPISIINEKILLPDLFNNMMEKREHIALVVDEFGGMSGIVTMEDVIETLLGTEIVDEMDNDTDMQALARKNWEKRAKGLGLIDGERK
ncbi:MAG: CBS domain containing-hemolysin-like protein [Gammaproteobacteria bacterium]|jgi:CBS domain containing-hemolysin-like protein